MDEITSKNASPADSIEDFNTNTTEIRQQLVETAVKFLQNPKVRKSPLSEKKVFLAGKGLNAAEIEASIEMAGVFTVDKDLRNRIDSSEHAQQYVSYPISRLSLIRDYCATIVFIGGAAYGFYHLIKKYLMPYWTGKPNETEDRIVKLELQMSDFHLTLNEMMSQLRDMIADLQVTLHQVNKKSEATTTIPLDNVLENQFGELHSEMKSLKGLLLNRHQFPAKPTITPMIPSWQLASDEEPVVVVGAESKTTAANCDDYAIVTEDDDETVKHSPFSVT